MINKILCFIGLHSWKHEEKWLPEFDAKLVTDYMIEVKCSKCGKILMSAHMQWNGEEMVEV